MEENLSSLPNKIFPFQNNNFQKQLSNILFALDFYFFKLRDHSKHNCFFNIACVA